MGMSPAGGPPGGMPPEALGLDPVTGVLTMPRFGQAFAQMSMGAPGPNMALWYIDVRNFRLINPKYGYLTGNKVLNEIVNGIRKHLSGDLPITRLGGDRFVFVSSGRGFKDALAAFDDMCADINAKAMEFGITSRLTLLGGVYYLRDEDFKSQDIKRALDYASISHRKAKSDPQTAIVFFTDEDLELDRRRIILEQTIDMALAEGQIEVWYQPQVDYIYGEIVGAEALARWNHPDLGWVSPAEFIPVLEEAGRIHDLDLYVWEEACRSAGRWRSMADGNPVPISVNVSRAEMFEPDLMLHFKELQKKYGLPHGCLHLEVTESAFVEEAERLYRVIDVMRKNDMVVEMDDFGSGLSSLNMLKDVPVDVVKLDMGFVRSGVNEERGGVVLGSIIRMLQGLDTPIIAEGVESLEQAELLKNMGCHLMQGFHFSRPMPLAEFENFIQSTSTSEQAISRKRTSSHLEDLMSFNKQSSYLFNEAIGGTMFVLTRGEQSESIIVNDKFYEECGLKRTDFGNSKVNPIMELDEGSRKTMWRAAAEAREYGSSMCTLQVLKTGRWIEACVRYLGDSNRGLIFSLTVTRSGKMVKKEREVWQAVQDFDLILGVLDTIVPHGFAKCYLDENLSLAYINRELVHNLDLSVDEFERRFHNSFIELVAREDRGRFMEAVFRSNETGGLIDCELSLQREFDGYIHAAILGRVVSGDKGKRLYLHIMLKGEMDGPGADASLAHVERVIPFDYHMKEDLLVIHAARLDGTLQDIEIEDWRVKLNDLPDNIDATSAARVLATIRDLRHHPISGFTDLKCNMRGGDALRWYHVNYTCDADEDGNTTVVHGYAQDANDEIGSVRWWRRQAEICPLTGLLNRNAAEQKINLLVRRHGGGMMFMVDLDGFKRVNDELGHLEGDELLHGVGEALMGQFRETDALGRYGGDEFVAFVPLPASGDYHDLAQRRADKIIRAISKIEISDGTHAACSVGVAICTTNEASFYDLLEIADQALYESKVSGKGCATIWDM